MRSHEFECPYCKTKWSIDEGASEVLCPGCDTIWMSSAAWTPKKSSNQPKFDVKIRGTKVPGCMGIKVEKTSYKAHSDVEYVMVAEFFEDTPMPMSGVSDVELVCRARPGEPIRFKADVAAGPSDQLIFHFGDEEFQQIAALWQKGDRP
jgi:hypothetical protein